MGRADIQEALTTQCVVAGATCCTIVGNIAPLRMVENVECLRAEFESDPLREAEVLEESHVEISSTRVPQNVTASIAKGQAARGGECSWVVECRTKSISQRNLNDA